MDRARNTAAGPTQADVAEAARKAWECGISVLPPREDGTKAPLTVLVDGEATWEPFKVRCASEEQVASWYRRQKLTGVGFVTGPVSGGLVMFEFDHRGTYESFREVATASGLGALIERIEAGYVEETPGDGVHWFFYTAATEPCTKLARRPKTPKEWTDSDRKAVESARSRGKDHRPVKTLIEIKGEGGFGIVAPSFGKVHPSGKPYRLVRGAVGSIVTLTADERDALWALAETFDELRPPPTPGVDPKPRARAGAGPGADDLPPWEDFNARMTWEAILEPHGWAKVYTKGETTYWRRPGKDRGVGATTNHRGLDGLYVFTSSTVLEADRGYDKVGAHVRLDHGGDFAAAARALRGLGYGGRERPGIHLKAAGLNGDGHGPPGPGAGARPGGGDEEPEWARLSDDDLGIIRLATVEERPVRWLWKYRLSMGGLSMMAGDGGIGKSQLLLWIGAAVSTGGPWCDGSGNAPLGNVVIVSAEDRADDTIKPRLRAMGADIERITIVKAKYVIRKKGKPPEVHPASFQERAYWREIFRRVPCTLFVVDPLPSYLGRGVNDSKNIEIRQILEPFLDEVIAPADICMLGNTHLNKSVDAKTPMHRISGSIAYGNLPRNVHFVVRDPDDDNRRYFKQGKCNNAPDNLPTIVFRVEGREVVNAEGEVIETAIPVFEAETIAGVDLAGAVAGTRGAGMGKRGPIPQKAVEVAAWLFDLLAGERHPMPWFLIADAAGAQGYVGERDPVTNYWTSTKILYRAMDLIPTLPPPRDGRRVESMRMTHNGGRKEFVHWQLVAADATF